MCTADKNCNAVEVNNCHHSKVCKGDCWHFYGDAKGTLTNGCTRQLGQNIGNQKCYAKLQKGGKPKVLKLAGNGKTSCSGNLERIFAGENSCKNAAKGLKKPFGGAGAFTRYPKGCYYNAAARRIFYNKAKTGKANSKASPICVIPTKK
jgi:hypothetical protein